jgi:hypothetical protein
MYPENSSLPKILSNIAQNGKLVYCFRITRHASGLSTRSDSGATRQQRGTDMVRRGTCKRRYTYHYSTLAIAYSYRNS